ncbi:hypothetical protein [Methylotuvimicrobium sp. KM2]|uniref:hypothetical protein n=1 Tax=Methylotuvimicrobium sp. KM2 TaxID=3133976 RepID=UPI0031013185
MKLDSIACRGREKKANAALALISPPSNTLQTTKIVNELLKSIQYHPLLETPFSN